MSPSQFQIGDWVSIPKPGIWQVYRVLDDIKHVDPMTNNEESKTLICVKRFVSKQFRKSFARDCYDVSLVCRLTKADQKKLDQFINKNPKVVAAVEAYEPEPIDAIYNARIEEPDGLRTEDVEVAVFSNRVFRQSEIEPYLSSLGFADGLPGWTVQFVCRDYECDADGYPQYRYSCVLDF